jgi:hypothetical protein
MFGERCFRQSAVLGTLCVVLLVIMQFKASKMKDVLGGRSTNLLQQGQQIDALKRQVTQLRQEKEEWEKERLSLYAGQRESASSNTTVVSPERDTNIDAILQDAQGQRQTALHPAQYFAEGRNQESCYLLQHLYSTQ